MSFQSDNIVGVSEPVLAALANIATGAMPPYGADPITAGLQDTYAALFEHELKILPMVSGTAANALAVSSVGGAFKAVACYDNAHILQTECGASEFYTPGIRLLPVAGPDGKMSAAALEAVLKQQLAGGSGAHVPAAISLTQLTEAGTVYTLDEIAALTSIARRHDLLVHMDGARFANAMVRLNCSPADLSWRAGVDVLSFGGTKNGTMCADAIVFFKPALADGFTRRLRRSGHDLSKLRFISVQLAAYVQDGLWVDNARHANASAQLLADGIRRVPGARLMYPVDGNIMFAALPNAVIERLVAGGAAPRVRRADEAHGVVRFVTSFETAESGIRALVEMMGG